MSKESDIFSLKLEILKAAIDRCNYLKIKHEYTVEDILVEYKKMEDVVLDQPYNSGFTGWKAVDVKR